MKNAKIHIGLRLRTMFLDHFIMCFIIVPPLIIISLTIKVESIITFAFYFMLFIYMNKDFIKGKSISKRILGLRVVNYNTGESASNFKCFLRNMTIPIWPLEVIFSLFSPTRRLGDLIANTKLEISNKEQASSILQDFKAEKLSQNILLTLLVGIIYMLVLWCFMHNFMGI